MSVVVQATPFLFWAANGRHEKRNGSVNVRNKRQKKTLTFGHRYTMTGVQNVKSKRVSRKHLGIGEFWVAFVRLVIASLGKMDGLKTIFEEFNKGINRGNPLVLVGDAWGEI